MIQQQFLGLKALLSSIPYNNKTNSDRLEFLIRPLNYGIKSDSETDLNFQNFIDGRADYRIAIKTIAWLLLLMDLFISENEIYSIIRVEPNDLILAIMEVASKYKYTDPN